ncbi:MAG: type II secretion system protein, partial [Planctomycetes bacterium]|nr:type II secretion system protein [Planctomycetota bacterium]
MNHRDIIKLRRRRSQKGFILIMVVAAVLILAIIGLGLLKISYGARLRAVRIQNVASAKLAAEAGYEKAIHWMSEQEDLLSTMAPLPGRNNRGSSAVKAISVE